MRAFLIAAAGLALLVATLVPGAQAVAPPIDCTMPADGSYIADCGTSLLYGASFTIGYGCAVVRLAGLPFFGPGGHAVFGNQCPNRGPDTTLFLCTLPADGSYIITCNTDDFIPIGYTRAGFTLAAVCAQAHYGNIVLGNDPCPGTSPTPLVCTQPADGSYIIDCGTQIRIYRQILSAEVIVGHGCQRAIFGFGGAPLYIGDACP